LKRDSEEEILSRVKTSQVEKFLHAAGTVLHDMIVELASELKLCASSITISFCHDAETNEFGWRVDARLDGQIAYAFDSDMASAFAKFAEGYKQLEKDARDAAN